jgi:pilus assembly protein Flp/PilA
VTFGRIETWWRAWVWQLDEPGSTDVSPADATSGGLSRSIGSTIMNPVNQSARRRDGTPERHRHGRQSIFALFVRRYAGRKTAMLPYAIAWVKDQLEREEEGQGLVEYALIIVLVSIAAIATLTALGAKVSGVFTTITGAL